MKKCIYCDFFSVPYDEILADRYTAALCRELQTRKTSARRLRTVYVGGGTPSMLPGDCLKQLFDCIRDSFDLSPSAEISVEMNPGAAGERTTEILLSLGVNRFSMGVQSFRDDELEMLGRIHTAGEALETIDAMKRAGIENFSIDLLYGIPGQTMHSWEETLSLAAELSPSHISAYELTPEKGTALYAGIESGRITMPDEEITAGMFEKTIEVLSSSGYEQYEISNYAVPGFRCLHNCNYWDRGEYVGAGSGAHSFLDGVRWMNTKDIGRYIDLLESNIQPEENRLLVSPEDAMREFIFLGLRKTEGISLRESASLGMPIEENCRDLIEEGYMASNGVSLRLTGKGLIISNTMIVTLFKRLGL